VGLVELFELAADCVTRSVVHAVLAARSVGGYTAYRDAFPSAVSQSSAVSQTSAVGESSALGETSAVGETGSVDERNS
jgi:ectoine hydroxylase-related dioxygenase (phytanoyl-CoA dioxygenase family)